MLLVNIILSPRSYKNINILFFFSRIKIYTIKCLRICEFLYDSEDISINAANITHLQLQQRGL